MKIKLNVETQMSYVVFTTCPPSPAQPRHPAVLRGHVGPQQPLGRVHRQPLVAPPPGRVGVVAVGVALGHALLLVRCQVASVPSPPCAGGHAPPPARAGGCACACARGSGCGCGPPRGCGSQSARTRG